MVKQKRSHPLTLLLTSETSEKRQTKVNCTTCVRQRRICVCCTSLSLVASSLECFFPSVALSKNVKDASDSSADLAELLLRHGLIPPLDSAVTGPASFCFLKSFFVSHALA